MASLKAVTRALPKAAWRACRKAVRTVRPSAAPMDFLMAGRTVSMTAAQKAQKLADLKAGRLADHLGGRTAAPTVLK
jgi:hypothetical protein